MPKLEADKLLFEWLKSIFVVFLTTDFALIAYFINGGGSTLSHRGALIAALFLSFGLCLIAGAMLDILKRGQNATL